MCDYTEWVRGQVFMYDSEAGMCSLNIDESGHLYRNGKTVVTEQRVKLVWR